MSEVTKIQWVESSALHFDRRNPRLADHGIQEDTAETEILQILCDEADVAELVQSIAASGFFPHEALIVSQEKGVQVVIEGNRRLAAVRLLTQPQTSRKLGFDAPKITAAIAATLKRLPVIFASREESWKYLGFKHVNGPAKWGSFAKAVYIAEVHRTHGVPLSQIAEQIGDRHRTVQRLYRGLMILQQAERAGVFQREDRYGGKFAFSHLYTGMDYDGISSFLGAVEPEAETDSPIPKKKLIELGELLRWLYGSKKLDQAPEVKTQNPDLRNLDSVLGNAESIAALRAGVGLSKALEISRPPEAVFEEALLAAKRELSTARAYLTIGYRESEPLLRTAGAVAEMAADLFDEMERKRDKSRPRRRSFTPGK